MAGTIVWPIPRVVLLAGLVITLSYYRSGSASRSRKAYAAEGFAKSESCVHSRRVYDWSVPSMMLYLLAVVSPDLREVFGRIFWSMGRSSIPQVMIIDIAGTICVQRIIQVRSSVSRLVESVIVITIRTHDAPVELTRVSRSNCWMTFRPTLHQHQIDHTTNVSLFLIPEYV